MFFLLTYAANLYVYGGFYPQLLQLNYFWILSDNIGSFNKIWFRIKLRLYCGY